MRKAFGCMYGKDASDHLRTLAGSGQEGGNGPRP
jgi:hypothetical protein